MSTLQDITILITSFLRPGYLNACLESIEKNLPECQIVVVDDSGNIPLLDTTNFLFPGELVQVPFDSGLTVKRNAGVQAVKTKYTLLGSDDFNFGTKECREGILKLLEVLDGWQDIDIASGRHPKHHAYEGNLEYVPGEYIKETRLVLNGIQPFYQCDLTVNYFLARTDVLRQYPWDETIRPIGGEHGDFFLTLKENSRKTVWVPDVWIDGFEYCQPWQHRDYNKYRGRAKETGHKIFLEKRNIKNYYGFDDAVPAPRQPRVQPRLREGTAERTVYKQFVPQPPSEKAKPLVMVMTCWKNIEQMSEIINTWLKEANGIDVRFFLGQPDYHDNPNIVYLDVADDYKSLPLKVQAAFKWAVENGYTHAFKCDDDTYVVPERLLNSGFEKHDYIGRVNRNPAGFYASGGSGYWLSKRCMQFVAEAQHDGDWAEDRWVGNVLRKNGFDPHHDDFYTLYGFPGEPLTNFHTACNVIPNMIGEGKLPRQTVSMREMHERFKATGRLPEIQKLPEQEQPRTGTRILRRGDGLPVGVKKQ